LSQQKQCRPDALCRTVTPAGSRHDQRLLLLAAQQLEVLDELRERHVEAVRQFEHDAQRGVDLAALDRPT
jgi:hypothetical protein